MIFLFIICVVSVLRIGQSKGGCLVKVKEYKEK